MWILIRNEESDISIVATSDDVQRAWNMWFQHTGDNDPGNAQRLLEYEDIVCDFGEHTTYHLVFTSLV